MSIREKIENIKKIKRLFFTTPSHNQGAFIVPEIKKYIGKTYFENDFSEIDGLDNLSNPNGIIYEAQKEASEIYLSKASFFLVNGSTSGVIASMIAVLNKGDKVLITRNCHKSVYNGLVLTGAVPIWLIPKFDYEWGIYEAIQPENLEIMLQKNRDIKAFIMPNPTYEGIVSDIYKIAKICKKYGIFLIVDEAHGALWNFNKSFGIPGIISGADITIQSLHKTAGAINPSAILHISQSSSINPDKIQNALNLVTTTSPAYPILLNIDETIKYLYSKKGKMHLIHLSMMISEFKRNLKDVQNLSIYSHLNDPTKILIKVYGLSGIELSNILSNSYNIEDELANEKSVLLLTGIGTTKQKLQKLETALRKLCSDNLKIVSEREQINTFYTCEPRVKYTPAEIFKQPYKEVEPKYLIARVCMEPIIAYPPGIPILLPGEVIQKDHLQYLQDRKTVKVLK